MTSIRHDGRVANGLFHLIDTENHLWGVSVADSGGKGVQMHPPLAASNVFLCK